MNLSSLDLCSNEFFSGNRWERACLAAHREPEVLGLSY